jgi:hypothetical protein
MDKDRGPWAIISGLLPILRFQTCEIGNMQLAYDLIWSTEMSLLGYWIVQFWTDAV